MSESKQEDAVHEQYNLRRMMRLITAEGPENLGESLRRDYKALQEVLEQKIKNNASASQQEEEEEKASGLFVKTADLEKWKSDITDSLKEASSR
jgi:hypothetical protein